MLSVKALHTEVSEPAVPQYLVAPCNEGDTRVDTTMPIRWGAWVRRLLMWEQVKSVAGRF
jgi:hypothetical protein